MESLEKLAEIFKALSDPIRLAILRVLAKQNLRKDICVGDLAKQLGTSQPNVSHHLKILKTSGLIQCQKRDNYAFYIVNAQRLEEITKLFRDQVFSN